MPKFLDTRKAIAEINDLIKNAGEKLILISPYLKISPDFQEILQFRDKRNLKTTIIFREEDLQQETISFLQTLRYVVLLSNKTVHAKCYLSDEKIVITSLNLYGFSMAHNKEMGVLLEKSNSPDRQAFEEAISEVRYIGEVSKQYYLKSEPSSSKEIVSPASIFSENKAGKLTGYCIRTGVLIPFNINKPMCYEAFKNWEQYGDPDHPEKYCHFSGELSNGETTFAKPILNKNWKKAREMYGF